MLKNKSIGTKKIFIITSAPFENTALDPVVTIPTTDTTKYGRTLEAGDFPSFSSPPESVKYIELCGVYGYNGSGGAVTVYWKMYKTPSGGSIAEVQTGNTSVANLNYFTVNCAFYDVSVGDLYEVSVWASSDTSVTVNGHIEHVAPTRVLPTSKNIIDVSETYANEVPGVGLVVTSYSKPYMNICEGSITSSPTTLLHPIRYYSNASGYYMYRYGRGDYAASNNGSIEVTTNSAQVPKLHISAIPTVTTYRELYEGKL